MIEGNLIGAPSQLTEEEEMNFLKMAGKISEVLKLQLETSEETV